MQRLVFILWTCALMFACGDASRADQHDSDAIQGTWQPSAAELAGQQWPEEIRKITTLVIKDDKYTVTVGDSPPDHGTIKLDPSPTPRTMDITGTEGPNKGKTILAIYELASGREGDESKNDTLRICYDLSGKGRPKEFKTATGTQLFLVTYQRAKR